MPEAQVSPVAERPSIQANLWAAGFFGLALLLVFHATTWSMVSIWLRSDTFAHGFLVLPISLWLVRIKSDRLRLINPRPAPWVAILLIPAAGCAWLLAWLVDVSVVQQLALVAMLVIGVWAILGHQLAQALAFPLLFLFFAVPMGEALIPGLMEFTATSAVWLIQQTGIPVYREGMYFTLPSGNWSVVEACSGVRYLIASVTLGALYAYLTYCSFWRRFLFVLASIIVSVFANALRAFIIVMLGHFSDMTIGTGKDHLVYGWVFFGLSMFLLFWLGSFFREDLDAAPGDDSSRNMNNPNEVGSTLKMLTTTLVALSAAAVWPLVAHTVESRSGGTNQHVGISLPVASGAWSALPVPTWRWQPDSAVTGQVAAYYGLEGQTLGLFIQYPDGFDMDGEVVGSSTRFVDKESGWRVMNRGRATVQLGDGVLTADQALLRGPGEQILAWSWYRIGELYTSNDYVAKFREVWARLGFGPSGAYRIVVALPVRDTVESSQAILEDYLEEHGHQLDEAMNQALWARK